MHKYLILTLCLLFGCSDPEATAGNETASKETAAQTEAAAQTKATAPEAPKAPADAVRIIKAADDALKWEMYDKSFAELKFDQKTLEIIKTTEKELAQTEGNAASHYRLTNVRIVGEDVQNLIFRNDYGDTTQLSLAQGKIESRCDLTFSGNGFSRCSQ